MALRNDASPSTVFIIESDVFQGCEVPMHIFIRSLQRKNKRKLRILVLRWKEHGRNTSLITERDILAGATTVLWYQMSTPTEILTKQILDFIRGGDISLTTTKEITRKPPRPHSNSATREKKTPHDFTKVHTRGKKKAPDTVKENPLPGPISVKPKPRQSKPLPQPKSSLPTWLSGLPIQNVPKKIK